MDKVVIGIYSVGLIVCMIFASGCSFHVGIDWQGKTDKSDTTESPGFHAAKGGKY